jgi:hypothetical protein
MEQTKALNALEPFLALSKSATSPRAASDLIMQATSAPNTYVFAELLQTPNIQNLRSSEEYSPYLTLLEIFAWGTWEDYKGMLDKLYTELGEVADNVQRSPAFPSSQHSSIRRSCYYRYCRSLARTPPSRTSTS